MTTRQAAYLSEISGLAPDDLAGNRLADLDRILQWRIDPLLLFFRRVCGRVVRADSATGIVHGVPNATVHVEDTDCSFLGFFPVEHPWWWWLWLVSCDREEIGTAVTDECGRFCVWIPRWDIDRILRFRLERVCFPDIHRPTVQDILIEYANPRPIERPPRPWPPEPDPWRVLDRDVLSRAADVLPQEAVSRLARYTGSRRFGDTTDELADALAAPAIGRGEFPPPITEAAIARLKRADPSKGQKVRADRQLEAAGLVEQAFHGPFVRCGDVLVAEWMWFFDTPDITFRVTQDVDEDGDEETIYDEGLFDVRWNVGDIPDAILEASAIARVSETCDGPSIACRNKPAIRTVGLMPLEPTHHDLATGYALRVNKPRPPNGEATDPSTFPGQAPYAGTLQLHGCHHIGGAEYYRLLYEQDGASEVPFTGLEWWAPRLGPGASFHIVPDRAGWYEILSEADLVFPHWLLNWPTRNFPNDTYVVRLELGDGAKAHMEYSDPVAFTTDNRAPNAGFTQIRWRVSGGGWLPERVLPLSLCPTIHRPAGADIEIEVTWFANAVHFRDAGLSGGGCGGGNPLPILDPAPLENHDFYRWHVGPGDNTVDRAALFTLAGTAPEGSYSFSIDAHTRAFNPAGDGGGPGTDWNADYDYSHTHPSIGIAVIDD